LDNKKPQKEEVKTQPTKESTFEGKTSESEEKNNFQEADDIKMSDISTEHKKQQKERAQYVRPPKKSL